MNKRIFLALILFVLVSFPLTFAHGEEEFTEAEELIKNKVSCDELTEDQLELLGDYYMEQMHPGELHEIMDERIGGEGSESLRSAHINMALSFYCGEHQAFGSGMMDIMMGRGSYGMMGMMQDTGYPSSYYRESNYLGWFFNWMLFLFIIIVLVLLIVLLVRSLGHKNYRVGKRNKFGR